MNTPRVAAMAVVLVAVTLAETVLLPGLAIRGVTPPLVVLSVVGFGLADGSEAGSRYGFAAGLLIDLLSGGLVGLSALVYLLAGYAAGALRPYLSASVLAGQVLIGAGVAAGSVGLFGVLSLLFGPSGPSIGAVVTSILVSAFYGALFAPVILRPIAALSARVGTLVST